MSLADLPCLSKIGLAVFAPTADQRLFLGTDWFLKTHVSTQMRRTTAQEETRFTHDAAVLQYLLTTPSVPGNRVLAIFGGAGSGKSELMVWLELMLREQHPQTPVIRITRTELNTQRVIERFNHWLTGDYFSDTTYQRWEEMKRKPRTFTKLLVLKALETMLSDDDQLNGIYYRLVDAVTPAIDALLKGDAIIGGEFLPKDVFESLHVESPRIDFDYETFRHILIDGFREYLLEGLNIAKTLRTISDNLQSQGIRPVLLIDDLVQSINLFATEFLDYFITLESGSWDVVIGLTPAAFQRDGRGRQLLERLTYLDTIDDRIEKWWLSDELGEDSVFLNEQNCVAFAENYLNAFRLLNNAVCSSCPILQRCTQVIDKGDRDRILAPFTAAVLIRLFRSLPTGKGKVRYYIRALHDVLDQVTDGIAIQHALDRVGRSELAVEHTDAALARFAAWFAPLHSDAWVTLDAELLSYFGWDAVPVKVYVTRLAKQPQPLVAEPPDQQNDPELEAVAMWLGGLPANRQLLQRLRMGAARWLREFADGGALVHRGIAKPKRILRVSAVYMDTSPPITLAELDDKAGIMLSRSVGHAAFSLMEVTRTPSESLRVLGGTLAGDERLPPYLWALEQYREEQRHTLETTLGCTLDQFAFDVWLLYALCAELPSLLTSEWGGFDPRFVARIKKMHQYVGGRIRPLNSNDQHKIQQLFDDCFRLRETLYDGWRLRQLSAKTSISTALKRLARLLAHQLSIGFMFGSEEFADVASRWATIAAEVCDALTQPRQMNDLSLEANKLIQTLKRGEAITLELITPETLTQLHTDAPHIYGRLQLVLNTQAKASH